MMGGGHKEDGGGVGHKCPSTLSHDLKPITSTGD